MLSNNTASRGWGAASSSVGGGAVCSSWLTDCLIVSNSALGVGGGAWYCTMSRCTLGGNSAALEGGGANQCNLTGCVLLTNTSAQRGGGACFGSLVNCTVVGNSAAVSCGGVGMMSGLRNSIIYYNTAPSEPELEHDNVIYDCCTPIYYRGVDKFSLPPLFVDRATGDLRLLSNSPCINSGRNAYVSDASLDRDGNPRIAGGTVDTGAYEYQAPASRVSYAFLQQFGLPADGSADDQDPDGDGMSNAQEWRCGTDPTNAASVLRLLSPIWSESGVTLTWPTVRSRTYLVQRATALGNAANFQTIATNLPASYSYTNTFLDYDAAFMPEPLFYRIGVAPSDRW